MGEPELQTGIRWKVRPAISVENCPDGRETARTWIFRLQSINNFLLAEDLLSGHLLLSLGAGLVLQFSPIGLGALQNVLESLFSRLATAINLSRND